MTINSQLNKSPSSPRSPTNENRAILQKRGSVCRAGRIQCRKACGKRGWRERAGHSQKACVVRRGVEGPRIRVRVDYGVRAGPQVQVERSDPGDAGRTDHACAGISQRRIRSEDMSTPVLQAKRTSRGAVPIVKMVRLNRADPGRAAERKRGGGWRSAGLLGHGGYV